MPPLRLQKILAQAGAASRRKAEEMISQGRVRVDGRVVTELGVKAEATAKVELDGKRLVRAPLCYGVLHKPKGMLTTLSDPEGRPTAGQILQRVGLRVVPVGRLDFNTSGALLFTNDGDFAAGLAHARTKAPKLYRAKVRGELDESQLARWADRIEIDGRKTESANVHLLRRERGHTWLEITLYEGRNRQVRRLGDHAGSTVVRLTRISQAGITIDGLDPGEFRLLTLDELKTLKASFGQPQRVRGALMNLAELPGYDPRPFRPRRPVRLGGESTDSHSEGRRAPPGRRSGPRGDDSDEGSEGRRPPAGRRAGPRRDSDERSEGRRPPAGRRAGPREERSEGRTVRPPREVRPSGTRPSGTRPGGTRPGGTRATEAPRPAARTRTSRPGRAGPNGAHPDRVGRTATRASASPSSDSGRLANREGARRSDVRAEHGSPAARRPTTATGRTTTRSAQAETRRSGHGPAFGHRPKKPR